MKKTKRTPLTSIGIITIVVIIGLAFTACDDSGNGSGDTGGNNSNSGTSGDSGGNNSGSGGDNNSGGGNQTPTASDYNIANLNQKVGNTIIAVTITAKSGKSPGAISNIRYAGNASVPQTFGTYAVYFAVAAATGWNAAPDIFAGNLVISYSIGDTGPGGGIIFYDKGNDSDGWRYLEAAPVNHATEVTWSSTNVDVTKATGTAIGTGKANTAAIIAAHSSDTTSNNAAKAAVAYTGGGKTDWFLPSKDELNEMHKAKTHLGISQQGYFWSSSQYSIDTAWIQTFGMGAADGYRVYSNKCGYIKIGGDEYAFEYYVRAVRTF